MSRNQQCPALDPLRALLLRGRTPGMHSKAAMASVSLAILVACVPDHTAPDSFRISAQGNLERTIFVADGIPSADRDCVSKINVWVHLEKDIATPLPADDAKAVKEGLYWTAVPRSGDRCLGAMPITYGDVQQGTSSIAAKPLRAGASYSVSITLGSDLGGIGHFLVSPDGRVSVIDNPEPGPGDPGPI